MDADDEDAPPRAPLPETNGVTLDPPVAALAFVDRPVVVIALRYPFVLNGAVVASLTVRRLVTADLITLAATNGDHFDAYALMTGLSPATLRGLDAEDGDRLTTAAYALLPGVLVGTRREPISPTDHPDQNSS